MEWALNIALVGIGLAALCYGGSWLVQGGVSIAKRLGLSPLVIGMTVVAYGTSTPELAASIAAGSEHGAIILGNVVGSNIANVGMVIGIAALLAPIAIARRTLVREIPIMIGFSILLVVISLDGLISFNDGMILIASLVIFTVYISKTAQKGHTDKEPNITNNSISKSALLVGIGMGALYIGSILTIDNAVLLAQGFGISERIIGITVVAIGTSMPELVTSIIAIRKGHTSIGIGNIIGSNIYNVLMIIGVSSALFSINLSTEMFTDYAIMIAFSASILIALRTQYIKKSMGAILVCVYVIYLATIALR